MKNQCAHYSLALVLAMGLVLPASSLQADAGAQQSLFKIERNKNANIVQYDIVFGEDGRFRKKKPVVAYWVRVAHGGEIRKLSWLQKRFAYGFKTKVDDRSDSIELDMVANIGRPIMVARTGQSYRAWMEIGHQDCFVDRMFIRSNGSGLSTKVEYIEMFGVSKLDSSVCYEKLEP